MPKHTDEDIAGFMEEESENDDDGEEVSVEYDCNKDHELGDRILGCIRRDDLEALHRIVVQNPGLDLSCFPGEPDRSSPVYGCIFWNARKVFMYLLTCNIDLDKEVHQMNCTALKYALYDYEKNYFFAHTLLDAGARVHYGVEDNEVLASSCFAILVRFITDDENGQETSKFYAMQLLRRVTFKLREDGNINNEMLDGSSYIHRFRTTPRITQMLLNAGADVNLRNARTHQVPLHLHAEYVHDVQVVKLLLENGAEVNALDKEHKTPLHRFLLSYAVDFDHEKSCQMVQTLLNHGAHVRFVEDMRCEFKIWVPCQVRSMIILHMLSHGYDPGFLLHVDFSVFPANLKAEIVKRVEDLYAHRAIAMLMPTRNNVFGLSSLSDDDLKTILDMSFPTLQHVRRKQQEPIVID